MLELLVAALVGGIIGWIASLLMGTDGQQGIFLNIIVGIVGSLLSKFLFSDVLKIGAAQSAGDFSIAGIFWGVLGALILIFILKALNVMR